MDDFSWWIAVALFWIYVVSDALYVAWTIAAVRRKAFLAGMLSSSMMVLLSIGVLNYVENHWYLIPIAMGSFAGSYFAVKFHNEDEPKKS